MSDTKKRVENTALSSGVFLTNFEEMYLHSAELNVVAVTENVNTFLLV